MFISLMKSKQSLLAVLLLLMFASCKQSEFYDKAQMLDGVGTPTGSDGGGTNTGGGDTGGPALCENGSTDNLICNPLGGGDGSNPTNPGGDIPAVPVSKLGLIAHLYEGQNQWNNLDQYFTEGYQHEENMYFSNFDVPTRAFDEGFGYAADIFLRNRNGEKLIEWFAIKANGNMVLPESETTGLYQIVTISDDGIQVTIDGKTIISNKGVHAPTV
ncbi:MAG: hypothetical protein H7177_00585, partial [Rhizobacter sp.]|nr:hypothetical protein [Bacteriovorax sp.]